METSEIQVQEITQNALFRYEMMDSVKNWLR